MRLMVSSAVRRLGESFLLYFLGLISFSSVVLSAAGFLPYFLWRVFSGASALSCLWRGVIIPVLAFPVVSWLWQFPILAFRGRLCWVFTDLCISGLSGGSGIRHPTATHRGGVFERLWDGGYATPVQNVSSSSRGPGEMPKKIHAE